MVTLLYAEKFNPFSCLLLKVWFRKTRGRKWADRKIYKLYKPSHKHICSRDHVLYFSPLSGPTQRLFAVLTLKVIENLRHVIATSMLQLITGQQWQTSDGCSEQSPLEAKENKPIQCESGPAGTAPGQSQPLPLSEILSGKTEMLKFKTGQQYYMVSRREDSCRWVLLCAKAASCPNASSASQAQRCRAAAWPLQRREASAFLVSIAKRTRGKVDGNYCDCAMRNRRPKPNSVISLFLFASLRASLRSVTQRQDIPSLWGREGFSGGRKFLNK